MLLAVALTGELTTPPRLVSAADEPLVDLTRVAAARVESATAPGGDAKAAAALFDGDPSSMVEAPASAKAPLDVVIGFGGATVAPERLRVLLPPGPPERPPCEVEILASMVSPITGFRTLRADPLKAEARFQEFPFPAVGARFLLLRFRPAAGTDRVAVAEVEVMGREGEPRSRYAFAEAPAKAFDVLGRLEKVSALHVEATPDEIALFRRARESPLDDATFADAALLASGVLDSARRAAYRKRLDALTQAARETVDPATGHEAKGEALLRWLHAGPMRKGYVSEQTDLSVLLDTATFNCVSSAVLYAILARRLGLDARAIEVPDHAFSIVYEGSTHVDVETTNAEGFNPARNPAGLAKLEATTGFRYIPDRHREQRREVDSAGLAAIIYYNHGVLLGRAGRHHEALLSYFRAMSLDAEFDSAVKNALAELANWGVELSKQGEHDAALEVLHTGLALAPEDALLRNNRVAVWSRWVEAATDAGKPADAVAIVRRAAADDPGGPFESMLAWPYLKPAEEKAKAQRWEEALALTDPALASLDGRARADVLSWRGGVRNRWMLSEAKAGRFEVAADVLRRALVEEPGDGGLERNAGWLAQEWALAVDATKGTAALVALMKDLVARFPGIPDVAKAGARVAHNKVVERMHAGRWSEALVALSDGSDLLDAPDRDSLQAGVYDGWAKEFVAQKKWSEAADVYAKGLAASPKSSVLRQNVIFLAQEWSRDTESKGPDAVAALGKDLAARFPSIPEVGQAGGRVTRNAIVEHIQSRRWAEALSALAAVRAASGLLEPRERDDLTVATYDGWAKDLVAEAKWAEAADVYAKGIADVPGDSRLSGNAAWLAQEWSGQAAQQAGAAAALDALRAMRRRFPGLPEVARVVKQSVFRVVEDLVGKTRYDEAVGAAVGAADVLDTDPDRAEVFERLYGRWASVREKAGDWEDAVGVYAKGLGRLPGNGRLTNGAAGTWDRWARTFFEKKDWDAAIALYDRALAALPDAGLLKNNRKYAQAQKGK